MTQPSFSCPRCGYETFLPSDIAAGYCPSCRWWTGDSLLGSEDVMAQNAIDGPLAEQTLWDMRSLDEAATNFSAGMRRMAAAYGMALDQFAEATRRLAAASSSPEVRRLLETLAADEDELTRADVEREWFGEPMTGPPTYRVARFVRALRRFQR